MYTKKIWKKLRKIIVKIILKKIWKIKIWLIKSKKIMKIIIIIIKSSHKMAYLKEDLLKD